MPPTNYEPRLVQVPAEPGAVLLPYTAPLSARSARPRGAGGPNFTFGDLAMLVVGVALLVWGLVAGWPAIVLVVASLITVVGLVLQVRKLVAWRRAAALPEPAGAPAGGTAASSDVAAPPAEPVLLLDLADPTSARLAGAYRGLTAILAGDDGPFPAAALSAAHQALVEAAVVLEGRPPATLPEVEELDERSSAIEALTGAVRGRQSGLPEPSADEPSDDAVARLELLRRAIEPAP